jgi:CHAD domain-containing protein
LLLFRKKRENRNNNMKAGDEIMTNERKSCLFCQREHLLLPIKQEYICDECLNEGNGERMMQWEALLQKQMNDYKHFCKRCVKVGHSEDIHQARVSGRKLKSILQFLEVKKKHSVLIRIKRIHKLLNTIREADVFIEAFEKREKENKIYKGMVKKVTIKRKNIQKELQSQMPFIMNADFFHDWEQFLSKELAFYVLTLEKDKRLNEYEQRFSHKIDTYHKAVKTHGKQHSKSIEALHKVRIQSKSLRYIYKELSDMMDQNFNPEKEYYKKIQTQFGAINDVQDWLNKVKQYKNKLNASQKDIGHVKKKLKIQLKKMIENVDLPRPNN